MKEKKIFRKKNCLTNWESIPGKTCRTTPRKTGKESFGQYSRSYRKWALVLVSKPRCEANRSSVQLHGPAFSADVRFKAPFAQSPRKLKQPSPRTTSSSSIQNVYLSLGSLGMWAAKLNQQNNHLCLFTPWYLLTMSRSSRPGQD